MATGQWLQVMQTTSTSLSWKSASETLLPSAVSRPLNLGAGEPTLSGAATAADDSTAAASAAVTKRVMRTLLVGPRSGENSGRTNGTPCVDAADRRPIRPARSLIDCRSRSPRRLPRGRHASDESHPQLLHYRAHRPRQEHPRG